MKSTMKRFLTAAACILMTLCLHQRGLAQTDTWIGGTGSWSDNNNWSLAAQPMPSNDCVFPSGSAPTDDIAGTCANVTLAAGDTLFLNPGYLDVYGTSISNAGAITIAGTHLDVGGNSGNTVSLSGLGSVSMTNPISLISGFQALGARW